MNQVKWIIAVVLVVSLAAVAWGATVPMETGTPAGANATAGATLTPATGAAATPAAGTTVTPTMTPATGAAATPATGANVTPTMGGNVTPSINVTNQTIQGNATIANVTIDKVVSDGPGWIVVHNSLFGALGGAVGFAPVQSGTNSNVTVVIDTLAATDQLKAELHKDLGQPGVFEYPAVDVPQMIDGKPVSANFSVTAENFTVKNLTQLASNQTTAAAGNVTPAVGGAGMATVTPTPVGVTPTMAAVTTTTAAATETLSTTSY